MRHRQIGQSGLALPALGLGTWSTFDTDEDLSPVIREALASDVTLFDCSPMYGRAEKALARALSHRRSDALVATKVSADNAVQGEAQIANALNLFGTVDLFQIHNIVGWRIHLPRLLELRDRGQIKAIGASQGLLVSDDAFEEIMRTGLLDCVQLRYNPKRQESVDRILPLAADLGIGVLVMQPLRWGVLLAAPERAELDQLEVGDWGAALLRWILSDERVTTVLTSSATPGRIQSNALVGNQSPFTASQMRLIDDILARGPRPGFGMRPGPVGDIFKAVGDYLSARLGACYCDICLAREFGVPAKQTAHIREALPADMFANEKGPCLSCGDTTMIARSRTIMR